MSEVQISYKDEGTKCGISQAVNSELPLHEVCNDGLSCIYADVGGGVFRKTCKSFSVIEGERCYPQYDMCYSNLECVLNVYGEYTCGGVVPWTDNPPYIKTGYLKFSDYCINIPLVVVGAAILFFYLLLLIYELYLKYDKNGNVKSIYSNRFGFINRQNGWSFNIFR